MGGTWCRVSCSCSCSSESEWKPACERAAVSVSVSGCAKRTDLPCEVACPARSSSSPPPPPPGEVLRLDGLRGVLGASTSPSQGAHALTTSPHRRHVQPSPSSAAMRCARQAKQYTQPHSAMYGLVMSVAAEPTTPPPAADSVRASASDVDEGFWSR